MSPNWLCRLAAASFLASFALFPSAGAAGTIENYRAVSDQRLQAPEAENWLMIRRTYNGWGYSPLAQINRDNVKNLAPAWVFSTSVTEGHESPPLVNNGVMFISTPQAQVIALDAKTGEELWRYRKQLPEDLFQLHPTNRGVALYGDRVYVTTTDAHLVALDAKTGKAAWDRTVSDYKGGYYMTCAPLIVRGKVMVGTSGGEYGVRGFVAAFDAASGQPLWKTFTVPGPGEPGNDTWAGDSWKHGAAPAWMTGTYDPQLNLVYWGTGNPGPWPPDVRKGDNLYATSVLALDPDSGKIKAYHQYQWNDAWDWDEVRAPLIIDLDKGGHVIKELVHSGRDGYLWQFERRPDKISYLSAQPFVYQNVFTSLDPETGRPQYDAKHIFSSTSSASFCPSLWGGDDWALEAYSPKTGYLYIPVNENLCSKLEGKLGPYEAGQLYIGADISKNLAYVRAGADHIGELQAWDLKNNRKVWTHTFPKSQNFGGVLATAGNVVFMGGTNDRMFRAFDAESGDLLWQQPTNSGVIAPPAAYEVDGVEYIAVESGWGVDPQRVQDIFNKDYPQYRREVPQGGVVWVFALKK